MSIPDPSLSELLILTAFGEESPCDLSVEDLRAIVKLRHGVSPKEDEFTTLMHFGLMRRGRFKRDGTDILDPTEEGERIRKQSNFQTRLSLSERVALEYLEARTDDSSFQLSTVYTPLAVRYGLGRNFDWAPTIRVLGAYGWVTFHVRSGNHMKITESGRKRLQRP